MPFVPTSSLLLLLPLVSGAASLNVAIVGAGAGGSSAAYWLSLAKQRAAPGTSLSITVYEQDSRVGGRSTTVYPYNDASYDPVELGASIFSPGNKNMMRATTEFGFERISFGAAVPGTGIWDGTKFVYRSDLDTDGSIYDERYQNGPATSAGLIGKFLTAFPKVYTPDLPQFQNISTLSASLGFTPLQTTTLESYFDQNGVNANWTNEYITSTIRFNYGQDVSAINGVAGMTSLAATSAYSVKAGNFKVFETFLAKSGASLKLNTKVSSIAKISKPAAGTKYVVTAGKSIDTYDAVIVAAPLPLTKIKFVNTAQPSSFPKVDYLHLHVTLLSTTTPALLPTYFKTPANASALPGTILTTGEYGVQPEFNSIRYQATIERNGKTEYVIKIFSKAKISDATLATLFGKGKVGWVYRKEWDAYPYFPPRSDYPPVKVDQGLYYVNSMEGFWSTMETETISSRNVVDLLSTELLGSGLCGAGGAKGPVTDTYVVGWDC